MASNAFKLHNKTITRFYSVANYEKGGDAKQGFHLKEAIKFAVQKNDVSKWKKVDAAACGIHRSMIPLASRTVLNIIQKEGHQCFLVGGCVRDLLLKRVPKDFDVITTANLKQIRSQFHRSVIVGQRFPVCIVNIKGEAIEVSSFDTVANGGTMDKLNNHPKRYTKIDYLLSRNSMHRDFTVNSLFYDPKTATIYDYNGGITDLNSLELRTLIPAHLSFQEDCARILRGLRIAARLNMSVSNDTATAIHSLSSSILTLAKSRIMMEINYMLSYGAAQPSLCLLERFNLLQVFFPCHAAILDKQADEGCSLSSTMLMKLFSNLDNMVACDRPAHPTLWTSLMVFHLALNIKPQEPLVIWTFSSLLCTKNWRRSVELARESALRQSLSAPEISKSFAHMEDAELASKVSELASLVVTSIDSLTKARSLFKSISIFKEKPSSVLIFVSEKCARETARLFSMFDADIKSYTTDKRKVDIDYKALKKGEALETRFVLGQIIMDTMSGKVKEALANSKPNQDTICEDKAYIEELLDHNLHRNPSVHATETPANKNEKFNDYLTKPSSRNMESVEIGNCQISPQNLDDYFLEELGPACTHGKSEEIITIANTDIKESIAMQKRYGVQDQVTEQLRQQEANNIVQQKMINLKQVIETLKLQTEIKFSDDGLKKGKHKADKMFELRPETPKKEGGDAKKTANETNNRKPLSSLFKSIAMEHNTSKKIVGIFNGNHQGPSDQVKDVVTTCERGTSESSRKSTDCNIVEAHEYSSGSRSSDEELPNVGRACQTEMTRMQHVSGKLQDETESLISILGLGGKHRTTKNQEILDTVSQVIKEKSLKEENGMHKVYIDETRDAIDVPGDDILQSDCDSDHKAASMKRKRIETRSKLHEKSKTSFTITDREISPSVDDDTKELHVDSWCQKNEDVSEPLEADQESVTSKQKLSSNLEPGTKTKTKTGRRTSQKSKNMVETTDKFKEEGTTDANLQHRKPGTKKRKTSQRQSKLKDEAPALDQDVDANITEALRDIRSQKGDEDEKETAKTSVTKTTNKPRKRRTVSKKQEITDISSGEIHENSHNDSRGDGNGVIQEQTTTNKKRKARSKSKDKLNDQPATLKTAVEFTDDHPKAATNMTSN